LVDATEISPCCRPENPGCPSCHTNAEPAHPERTWGFRERGKSHTPEPLCCPWITDRVFDRFSFLTLRGHVARCARSSVAHRAVGEMLVVDMMESEESAALLGLIGRRLPFRIEHRRGRALMLADSHSSGAYSRPTMTGAGAIEAGPPQRPAAFIEHASSTSALSCPRSSRKTGSRARQFGCSSMVPGTFI
jgi:hypothetical protein